MARSADPMSYATGVTYVLPLRLARTLFDLLAEIGLDVAPVLEYPRPTCKSRDLRCARRRAMQDSEIAEVSRR